MSVVISSKTVPKKHVSAPRQLIETAAPHSPSPPLHLPLQFSLFPLLPTETRLQIWRASFPSPKTSFIALSRSSSFSQASPGIDVLAHELGTKDPFELPVTLRVCQESREETLRYYVVYVPDNEVFKRGRRKGYGYGAAWRTICFDAGRDEVVLVHRNRDTSSILELLVREILHHDSLPSQVLSLMQTLHTIRLDWQSINNGPPPPPRMSGKHRYCPADDFPDDFFPSWSKIRSIISLLPTISVVEIYQSRAVIFDIAYSGTYDFSQEIEVFVKEMRKAVPGHRIEKVVIVEYKLQPEDTKNGWPPGTVGFLF